MMPRIENGTAISLVKSKGVAAAGDPADDMVCPGFQPGLHGGERGRCKPRLRDGAVGGMVGIVHLQQADDIGLAEHPLEALLGHLAGEERARSGGEGSTSALHGRNIAGRLRSQNGRMPGVSTTTPAPRHAAV